MVGYKFSGSLLQGISTQLNTGKQVTRSYLSDSHSHFVACCSNFLFPVGGLYLPPKFEHIFVAVITFPPFLLCKYF